MKRKLIQIITNERKALGTSSPTNSIQIERFALSLRQLVHKREIQCLRISDANPARPCDVSDNLFNKFAEELEKVRKFANAKRWKTAYRQTMERLHNKVIVMHNKARFQTSANSLRKRNECYAIGKNSRNVCGKVQRVWV